MKDQKKEIIVIGEMDGTIDGSFECRNRVHGGGGISPTLQAVQFVYVIEARNEDQGKQRTWIL